MAKKVTPRFNNRELSWLEFNQRVLDQGRDPEVPLLERLKFLAISAANLDEFFMVRVGGLQVLQRDGRRAKDISGMTPLQQLRAIGSRARSMIEDQYSLLLDELEPALARHGFVRMVPEELNEEQVSHVKQVFTTLIHPVVTPMAIHDPDRFPLVKALTTYLVVRLDPKNGSRKPRFAILPVGLGLERFIALPSSKRYAYLLVEDAATMLIQHWFPGEEVRECATFRITRNADLMVRDDRASDLLAQMSDVLVERVRSHCTRLEVQEGASATLLRFLREALDVTAEDLYEIRGPLELRGFMTQAGIDGFEELQDESWPAQPSPLMEDGKSMFEILSARNLLFHHPYESFDPVIRLVEEAAEDPDVLAIKQILYRVSPESPMVRALMRAAKRGKYVTVIVELKARFDEAANIGWAQSMEEAGVQVIHGIKELKTHAKTLIVIRQETAGIRRYMHFGTGNYNEGTARFYTDISFMTSHDDYGSDATTFFNTISGYSQPQPFHRLHMSPFGIRDQLISMIEGEIDRRKQGQKSLIMMKCNSLQDPAIINKLYEASQAGVEVQLCVRGICCLQPGLKKISENITVISIIDRFLEHSRIYFFHHGGDEKVFIASADLMVRNLEKRIELMVPIEDRAFRKRLRGILKTLFKDTTKARVLQPDGTYAPVTNAPRKKVRCQEVLYREACDEKTRSKRSKAIVFEPLRPPRKPS